LELKAKTVGKLQKNHCTGCGACSNACNAGAILMKADSEGFPYPVIDTASCAECSRCYFSCPVSNPINTENTWSAPKVYAAWSLDNDVRYDSTSGGIFTELAKTVLENGGCVAGAKYNSKHLVEHTLIYNADDIYLLRQSKYVQSETKDIFRKAETELRNGKTVLFCGTPCQCAGMKGYLRGEYAGLLLCDFICRGVNSPFVYLKYLQELEECYDSKVKQVWFKNKAYGWNKFGTKIVFADGQEYFGGRDDDPFMYGYIKNGLNLYMRPSCGNCAFTGINRSTDITLGDFWGVKTEPDHGVSIVMLHSAKSEAVIERIKSNIYIEARSVDDILPYNRCLVESAKNGSMRENFWENVRNDSFTHTLEMYK
jgi:coenzyme F420-reducing hydrogenase beta subunit